MEAFKNMLGAMENNIIDTRLGKLSVKIKK